MNSNSIASLLGLIAFSLDATAQVNVSSYNPDLSEPTSAHVAGAGLLVGLIPGQNPDPCPEIDCSTTLIIYVHGHNTTTPAAAQ